MAAQYGLSGKLGWLHEPAWLHWKGHALLLDPNKPLVCAPVQLHGKREATTYIADYVGHTSGCRTLCEMQTFSLRMGVRSNYLGIEREKEKKNCKKPWVFWNGMPIYLIGLGPTCWETSHVNGGQGGGIWNGFSRLCGCLCLIQGHLFLTL